MQKYTTTVERSLPTGPLSRSLNFPQPWSPHRSNAVASSPRYTMEYYSAIKKNTFESVLMRWMKQEPVLQSEVSQKVKHQYSILMHIYGILNDGNDDPICETSKETQT